MTSSLSIATFQLKGALAALVVVVALSTASAQVPGPALGQRPASDIQFNPPSTIDLEKDGTINYSLCQGEKPAMRTNRECGGPFNGSNRVKGGNPPYHFQLDSGGGFPPFGIHLDKDGNLVGKLSKGARGGSFSVCAVDLSESQACQKITINSPTASTKTQQQAGTSHALRNTLLIVGGGAVAGVAIAAACANGKCSGGGCVSNRSCIVSVLGGGCECTGATSGYCGVSGPVAQAGQACGNGSACATGLSCNNGICQGSNGSCPF